MGELGLLGKLIEINTVNSQNGSTVEDQILSYLDKNAKEFSYSSYRSEGVLNSVIVAGYGKKATVLNGHYDVVPANEKDWQTDPFKAHKKKNIMFGRGANDMKGGIVSITKAFADFTNSKKINDKKLILMLTGDEETGSKHGAEFVLKKINKKYSLEKAIITEPSSSEKVADKVRIGARGVLWLQVEIEGKSGHASRPHQFKNPLDAAVMLVHYLKNLQIAEKSNMARTTIVPTHIQSVDIAKNVIPHSTSIRFDIRYNHAVNPKSILKIINSYLTNLGYKCKLKVISVQEPFLNESKIFQNQVLAAIKKVTNHTPSFITEGGTGDIRHFSRYKIPSIEFGARICNMHSADEHVHLDDISNTTKIISELI